MLPVQLVPAASWPLPEAALANGAVRWNVLLLTTSVIDSADRCCPLLVRRERDVTKRLTVARVLLLYRGDASAALASTRPSDILAMVGWAFSLAMAGNFPAHHHGHLVEADDDGRAPSAA